MCRSYIAGQLADPQHRKVTVRLENYRENRHTKRKYRVFYQVTAVAEQMYMVFLWTVTNLFTHNACEWKPLRWLTNCGNSKLLKRPPEYRKPNILIKTPFETCQHALHSHVTLLFLLLMCVYVCILMLPGAAEAHGRAEAAAGRALEACGSVCDRARPDGWDHEGWGHTRCWCTLSHTVTQLGFTTFMMSRLRGPFNVWKLCIFSNHLCYLKKQNVTLFGGI